MESEAVVAHAKRLIGKLRQIEAAHEHGYEQGLPSVRGVQAQVVEFLRSYAGPRSSFAKSAESAGGADGYCANILVSVLEAFIDRMEAGLMAGVSPERQAQLDVVSDLLGQAHLLLETSGVHPAAPTVLIGASLEEFLRTWVEAVGLSLGNRKPSLSAYALTLREGELLQKQDIKDIESWGGLRNHAAHGEWDAVGDRQRITLMLEGVNLFMRRYGPSSAA